MKRKSNLQGPAPIKFNHATILYLESLGSSFARVLGPQMTWVWVFAKGGRTFSEGITFTMKQVREIMNS